MRKQGKTDSGIRSRTMSLRLRQDGAPATLDEETRSVEVVGATEEPAKVFDWNSMCIIDEVLLMSGCRIPGQKQVPLLDSHSRWSTESVVGSYRGMRVEDDKLLGRAHFTTLEEGERPFVKLREGHLTDFSVGYRVNKEVRIEEGKTVTVEGRDFAGPVVVVTEWSVKELSICPIGADPNAKARAEAETTLQEDSGMEKRLREALESRGLAKDATEEQAWEFFDKLEARKAEPEGGEPKAPAVPAAVEPVDPKAAAREAVAEERARTSEILALGERFDCGDLARKLASEDKTVDQAREAVLAHVEKSRAKQSGQSGDLGFRVEVGTSDKEKFRSAATDALAVANGLRVDKPAPGHDELMGYSLRDMARHSLVLAGQPTGGNPMEMVIRAFSSSDLPYILGNVANLSIMEGWDGAEETWEKWADGSGMLPDFKEATLARLSEFDDLDEIPEGGEYKHGKFDETKEVVKIAKYGKKFAITYEGIINDDQNAITGVPKAMGEAAARKVGDLPYAVLTANAAMGDGVALFHTASHSNLASSGAAASVTTLDTAFAAMAKQKDKQALRRLNIRPAFYLGPVSSMGSAEKFFRTELIGGESNQPNLANIYSGAVVERVYEARLDDNSTAAWYLAARKGRTVKVFFLKGVRAPYMEQLLTSNVDGREFKVRIEAAAKALDYRGLYKNPGA